MYLVTTTTVCVIQRRTLSCRVDLGLRAPRDSIPNILRSTAAGLSYHLHRGDIDVVWVRSALSDARSIIQATVELWTDGTHRRVVIYCPLRTPRDEIRDAIYVSGRLIEKRIWAFSRLLPATQFVGPQKGLFHFVRPLRQPKEEAQPIQPPRSSPASSHP